MAKSVRLRIGIEGFDTYAAAVPEARQELVVEVDEAEAVWWPRDEGLHVVGTEVPRTDGPAKATGAARFTYDMQPTGLAFVGLVAAPYGHATARRVDARRAASMPGVLAVRTFEGRRVTFPGEIVAAVCAASEEVLDDALRAVVVEYDVLGQAATVEDAMAPGAAQVDPAAPNAPAGEPKDRMRRGNPDSAWDAAAVRVEATYRTAIQTHSALEPHGVVVAVQPDGDATVWASTQAASGFTGPGMLRALELPAARVRTLVDHVGGGFGAKFGALEWDTIAASFARETKRPVRMLLDRRMEHLVGGNRPDSIQRMALAGSADGTFQVLRGDTLGTAGNAAGGAGANNVMIYEFPHVDMAQRTVRTFTARAAAFRAPRHPQGSFALEGIIDRFAHAAQLDPLDVRLKNDRHPIRRVQWRLAADRFRWHELRGSKRRDGRWHLGVGCAASRWSQVGRGEWQMDLKLHADGRATLMNGAQDIGTGTKTVLAMLVAEELHLPVDHVEVRLGDTRFPAGPGSGGSTTLPSLGPVARDAAVALRRALAKRLAELWESDPDAVGWSDGRFVAGERRATVAEAARSLGRDGLQVSAIRRPNQRGEYGETAGCQMAEVAVDPETGVVRVVRVVAVHDAGRIVDRMTARSQVNGGVIQGISYALYEERRLDRATGDMVNPTLDTYRILGMADCPEIDVVFTSVVNGFNNAGLAGLGEPATVPTAAAVANAVYHALGVQVAELPMTPARVLAALEGAAR